MLKIITYFNCILNMGDYSTSNSVAIVNMSCRFAGCADLRAYWMRILSGDPAFSNYRGLDADHFLDLPQDDFCHISTLRAAYLNDLWQINQSSSSINAAALQGTNPEISLISELADIAMKSAGKTTSQRERIGAVIGYAPEIDPSSANWYQYGIGLDQTVDLIRKCFPHGATAEFEALRNSLSSTLPQYDSRNIHTLFHSTLATILSEHLDICGPVYCVNAASVSSLLAIQSACDALLLGRADVMLAGAIQGLVTPQLLMPLSRMGLLSKLDYPRPFGAEADGMLLGEGGGILVLKRYDDAIRDGNRIYAVIKGCGIAAEGVKRKSGDSLPTAMKLAISQSGIDKSSITLIEASGSAIPLQDKLEVKAMTSVFDPQSDAYFPGTIALGSVKGLVGNCGAAAGIAGVIKASLALYHRLIPPAQEAKTPSPQLKLSSTPFYLNMSARPWVHNDAGEPRRAGVTALSAGGFAGHLILEQPRRSNG